MIVLFIVKMGDNIMTSHTKKHKYQEVINIKFIDDWNVLELAYESFRVSPYAQRKMLILATIPNMYLICQYRKILR